MLDDEFASAVVAHESDLEALADLDDSQLDYLSRLHELPDPITDGIVNDRCI